MGLGRLGMVQGRLLEEVMANWKAEGQVAVIQRKRTRGRRKALQKEKRQSSHSSEIGKGAFKEPKEVKCTSVRGLKKQGSGHKSV